jgi:Skp family chaperone for outer membrane proteins
MIFKKYFNIISIILILIISITIIIYSNLKGYKEVDTVECYENSDTLDNRVTKLEEQINGIKEKLDKKTPDNRISILESSIPGIHNILDNFNGMDEDRYKKMYSWYARLTGSDPELIKKEDDKKREENENKYNNMEEEMKRKYNKT